MHFLAIYSPLSQSWFDWWIEISLFLLIMRNCVRNTTHRPILFESTNNRLEIHCFKLRINWKANFLSFWKIDWAFHFVPLGFYKYYLKLSMIPLRYKWVFHFSLRNFLWIWLQSLSCFTDLRWLQNKYILISYNV